MSTRLSRALLDPNLFEGPLVEQGEIPLLATGGKATARWQANIDGCFRAPVERLQDAYSWKAARVLEVALAAWFAVMNRRTPRRVGGAGRMVLVPSATGCALRRAATESGKSPAALAAAVVRDHFGISGELPPEIPASEPARDRWQINLPEDARLGMTTAVEAHSIPLASAVDGALRLAVCILGCQGTGDRILPARSWYEVTRAAADAGKAPPVLVAEILEREFAPAN